MIPVLCFGILNRTLASIVRAEETGVYPDVILNNLSTNQYFYERHMNNVLYHASVVAYFGGEDAIIEGLHLRWYETRHTVYHYYDDFSGEYDESGYYLGEGDLSHFSNETRFELKTPDDRFYYGYLSESDFNDHGIRTLYEQNAIRSQLSSFRSALDFLFNVEDLLFFITIETAEEVPPIHYSNLSYVFNNADFFRAQALYFISTGGHTEHSSPIEHGYRTWMDSFSGDVRADIFLAYSHGFVEYKNYIYSTVRNEYLFDLSLIIAFGVLILGMTILLMVAAGRKYKVTAGDSARADKVHFTILDKPYLDISLALLVCWVAFLTLLTFNFANTVWFLGNIIAMNIILASATFLAVPPVLGWLMSFSKRLKAGRFWKHTLIYAIVYSCLYGSLRFLIRAAKELWAGTRLTLRVVLISIALFFMMFFVGLIGAETRALGAVLLVIIIFTAIITVCMLLYARRIRDLELGARAASEGDYEIPINAGGGELGNIANSINNISAGINTAVEERMKSERLKTELITNVSHDIRTPLTSIITYTDLLDHEGLDCERAPEYLDVLKQKSLRLKTLTEELFEAAKAATGNIDVSLTDLNVVSLINQVMGELDNSIKSSGLDLRVNLPEKLLARADGRLMQRVLENLFSNVFKYSLPGSRVYLDARQDHARQSDSSQVRIDLKNISTQELNFDPSELTERFKRGDDSRSDGGSGLGLSIVQSFMDAQGGKFEVSIDGDLFKATVLLPVPPVTAATPDMPS